MSDDIKKDKEINSDSGGVQLVEMDEKAVIEKEKAIQTSIDKFIAPENNVAKNKKQYKTRRKRVQVPDSKRFKADLKNGLTTSEVNLRKKQLQQNLKPKSNSKSNLSIVCSNIFTFFNFLCALCVVALLYVNSSPLNFTFCIIYVVNLSIGIFQEIKAKKAIEKLSLVKAPTANILRNAVLEKLPITEIVLDDIISLSMGDQISADSEIVKGTCEVNESLLTGESVAVKKKIGDTLLAGSFVTSGNVFARVDKVGEDCYVEKLTKKAKRFKKPTSELMISLKWIIRIIGVIIIPIAILAFLTNCDVMLKDPSAVELGFVLDGKITSTGLTDIVTRTTAVIIGMIPSGMFLLTTIALSVGVVRLVKHNTSVQDMYSLEMLARVDCLCLDKTGTITDGRMKVSNCVIFDTQFKYNINDIISSMQSALDDNNQTAVALRNYFGNELKLLPSATLPFSSSRKYSAVSFIKGKENLGTFALGAPEFILPKSKMTTVVKDQIARYASMGQRVLMLAHSEKQMQGEEQLNDYSAFALITLSDNIREDAIQTIEWFKKNGVEVKVISGDNPATVAEVARRAGVNNTSEYVSLEGMAKEEVINIANKYTVFGRVTPEQKALLIKSIKSAGHTVAMTGDGVNDILAMKESDCSITVASGSDATKNIAHLVLMDNNFNSMPQVVAEGRRVINNIEKSSSLYLMKTLFTAIFAIIAIFNGTGYPFNNQMMIMLETLVIAVASFCLTLQDNTSKVKGKFISYIFTHAIPGALILVFNVYAFEVFLDLPGIVMSKEFTNTLYVGVLTFGGIVYLYRVCQPFNVFRVFLFAFIFSASCVWICFLMPFFDMANLIENFIENWKYVLFLVCLVQLDFPLSKVLISLTTKFKSNIYESTEME